MSSRSHASEEGGQLSAGAVWKGENESDAELVENYDVNPLEEAGAWTEDEAYTIYREKLVRLRDLYVGQLSRMRHLLRERRRQFLLEWQSEGGLRTHASRPSQGGTQEDAAYRCYRKRSGEEALLERQQKRQRVAVSLDVFSQREAREANTPHYHHLLRLHQQVGPVIHPPCANPGCENQCMPFTNRCSRHICEDQRQMLYTRCSYVYPTGSQCSNPVPQHLDPRLCGGHCDNVSPPENALDESATKGDSLLEDEVGSMERSESSGLDGRESGMGTEEAVFEPSGKESLLFGGEGSNSATERRERETGSILEVGLEGKAVTTDSEMTAVRTGREETETSVIGREESGLFLAKKEGESPGERRGEEGGGERMVEET